MAKRSFGMIVASAVTVLIAAQAAVAQTSGGEAPQAGKCVHSCSGHAECKGNGNNSCKGKNSCANTGIVPKKCSAKKTEADCTSVVDAKKERVCSWYN